MLPNMPRGGLGRCQQHEGDRQQEPHRGLRGADYLAFPAAKANGPVGVSHRKKAFDCFPPYLFRHGAPRADDSRQRASRVGLQTLPSSFASLPMHGTRDTLA